jgi:hypothetical protein
VWIDVLLRSVALIPLVSWSAIRARFSGEVSPEGRERPGHSRKSTT